MVSQSIQPSTNLLQWAGRFSLYSTENFAMDIKIDNHYEYKAYTPGVPISGFVLITTANDTPFGKIEINLNGISFILADYLQPDSVRSTHPFLRLKMPIDDSLIPESGVFKCGTTHAIPFTFVIPRQLPIGACAYKCSSETLRDQHLRPPPTMGYWDANDLAPGLVKVKYSVDARVFRSNSRDVLMETSYEIGVLPALPEEAPLHITDDDKVYCLSQTKEIRKGMMSGKIGHLRAVASQPRAIVLTPGSLESTASPLSVGLEFISTSDDVRPPQLNSVSATLESHTYFCLNHIRHMPNLDRLNHQQPIPVRLYAASEKLSPSLPECIAWESVHSSRKSSVSCHSSQMEHVMMSEAEDKVVWDETSENSTFSCYEARYEIVLTLPLSRNKLFLPSFHSCLASRTYLVNLTLVFGPQNTTISLAVPLQIANKDISGSDADELPHYPCLEDEFDAENVEHAILPAYGKFV